LQAATTEAEEGVMIRATQTAEVAATPEAGIREAVAIEVATVVEIGVATVLAITMEEEAATKIEMRDIRAVIEELPESQKNKTLTIRVPFVIISKLETVSMEPLACLLMERVTLDLQLTNTCTQSKQQLQLVSHPSHLLQEVDMCLRLTYRQTLGSLL
jgi:hypothetical protein